MSEKSDAERPLLRILLFGILLAITLLTLFGPRLSSGEDHRIVIADDDMAHILVNWQRTWQRPPTKEELSGLMERYVRDEVLYRESISLGLDENNAVVKRSLIMQMDQLAENQADEKEITEEDIVAYYTLRQEQYEVPGIISISQIYFDPSKHEDGVENHVSEIVSRLNESDVDLATAAEFGDPIMLESDYSRRSVDQIQRDFGEAFAGSVLDLPVGLWSGPVESGYGWHAVFVREKELPRPAPLDQVRGDIIREIQYEQKDAAKEQFYTELMREYDIVYEGAAKDFLNAE